MEAEKRARIKWWLSGLSQLSQDASAKDRHIEILYWYCKEKGAARNETELKRAVADRVNLSSDAVYQQRNAVNTALKCARLNESDDDICQVLFEMVGDPPQFQPWPPDDIEQPQIVFASIPASGDDATATQSRSSRIWPFGLGFILGLILALVFGFAWVNSRQDAAFPLDSPVVETVLVTSEAPSIVEVPIEVTRIVDGPVTEIEVTRVVEATTDSISLNTAQAQIIKTQVAEEVQTILAQTPDLPIVGTIVEPTNTPTMTTIPTPTSLFEDDFDPDISPEWNISGDNYTVVDKALSSSGDLNMYIGDTSWEDYMFEFRLNSVGGAVDYNNGSAFIVRRQDEDNFLAFIIGHSSGACFVKWIEVVDGQQQEILDSQILISTRSQNCYVPWQIKVDGNSITTYRDSGEIKSFNNNRLTSGGIGIITRGENNSLKIDNILVTSLNQAE